MNIAKEASVLLSFRYFNTNLQFSLVIGLISGIMLGSLFISPKLCIKFVYWSYSCCYYSYFFLWNRTGDDEINVYSVLGTWNFAYMYVIIFFLGGFYVLTCWFLICYWKLQFSVNVGGCFWIFSFSFSGGVLCVSCVDWFYFRLLFIYYYVDLVSNLSTFCVWFFCTFSLLKE